MNRIKHSKPSISYNEKQNLLEVLGQGNIAMGNKSMMFVSQVTKYLDSSDGILFPSGTIALIESLKLLGAGPGKEVVFPTYVCNSLLSAVKYVGAIPIMTDIDINGWNISEENLKSKVSSRTCALIIPHIFGISINLAMFRSFGIPIIEDCAQAFGAKYNGEKVGSIGDVAIYSFNATKCLTTGEGGLMVVNNHNFLNENLPCPTNTFTDLQAAIGISQISRFDCFLKRRKQIADYYFENLPDEFLERLRLYSKDSMFFRFPLFGDFNFERLKHQMDKNHIDIRKGVDQLCHRFICSKDISYPNAVNTLNKTLSIPIYPDLTDSEVDKISNLLTKFLNE